MKFTNTLIKGKLIKRYKRFFTDIKVNNSIVTAHCPNTGSMFGLLERTMKLGLVRLMIQRENLNLPWRC